MPPAPASPTKPIKMIARNKRARHDYELDDEFEAGLMLLGSEVKSLREGKATLSSAHVRVLHGEAWVYGLQIPEYAWSHQFNHDVERPRKLLLHRRQIDRLDAALGTRGMACVVLAIYFRGAHVKIEIGIGRGRKQHDKREKLKQSDAQREIARALRG